MDIYRKEAKERKKESGKRHGRGQEKVRTHGPEPISGGRAREKAGKAVGVSGASIDRAAKVTEKLRKAQYLPTLKHLPTPCILCKIVVDRSCSSRFFLSLRARAVSFLVGDPQMHTV
ncbi:hypothetical protein ACFL6U_22645 [Planctomycetota bacterium]